MDSKDLDGLSRRRMLKGLGAGATVAWSAPALMSVTGATASAASPACAGNDYVCGGEAVLCGEPLCVCETTTEGTSACMNYDLFCADVPACNSTADCPAGWSCETGNNCCGESRCYPPCGVGAGGVATSGTRPLG